MSADALGTLAYVLQRARPFARFVSGRQRATRFRFTFDKHDFVGGRILRYQTWERQLTAWIDAYLETVATPGLFVDVGANIGWFSLMAARHPRVEKVVVFEPDSINGFPLDTNVRTNGLDAAVTTVGCALGDARGMATLHRYKHSNLGQHSLLKDFGHGGAVVMLETLDHVLDQLGLAAQPIAGMKIDVEGYEPRVPAGASAALRRTQCVVVEPSRTFSVHAGLDFAGMVDSLQARGFAPVLSDQANPVPGFATLRRQDRQTTVAFVPPTASMAVHAVVRH